jgi:hypothetical protein
MDHGFESRAVHVCVPAFTCAHTVHTFIGTVSQRRSRTDYATEYIKENPLYHVFDRLSL